MKNEENRKSEIVLAARRARLKFAKEYCEEKGWPFDVKELSVKQIIEIRNQNGWMYPDWNSEYEI